MPSLPSPTSLFKRGLGLNNGWSGSLSCQPVDIVTASVKAKVERLMRQNKIKSFWEQIVFFLRKTAPNETYVFCRLHGAEFILDPTACHEVSDVNLAMSLIQFSPIKSTGKITLRRKHYVNLNPTKIKNGNFLDTINVILKYKKKNFQPLCVRKHCKVFFIVNFHHVVILVLGIEISPFVTRNS